MDEILIPSLRFPEFEDKWIKTELGKVAKFSKGKNLSKNDILENGLNECIRYGELYTTYSETISDVYSKTNLKLEDSVLSEANDVIIPASGETQLDIATASCILKKGIIIGGDLNIVRTTNNGVFLSYYLNSAKKFDIAKLSQGSSVIHLYSKQLSSLIINLPKLDEQVKIASFLSDIDSKINLQIEKRDLLVQYKKGIIDKIFNGVIRFKDINGNHFPKWKKKKINDVFKSFKGKGIPKGDVVYEGINKCILYGELYTRYAEVIFEILSKTNSKEGLLSVNGDLLIPSSTTTTGIDLANVTALNFDNVLLGGDIIVLRAKSIINSVFYAYYLSNFKKYEIASRAQGITIVHLYFNSIKDLEIDVPLIEEQDKIANFLSVIDTRINVINKKIEESIILKKGLLQKMFV
jgi:type I restriction enzyme S subunit